MRPKQIFKLYSNKTANQRDQIKKLIQFVRSSCFGEAKLLLSVWQWHWYQVECFEFDLLILCVRNDSVTIFLYLNMMKP